MVTTEPGGDPAAHRRPAGGRGALGGLSLVPVVLAVAASVYLLDRASKLWALNNLVQNVPQDFVGSVLRLRLIFNPGAAFSLGTGATPLFTVIQAVVSVAVLVAATRVGRLLWAVALGLVLGGASGNLTDRLTRPPGFGLGHVVDFLELPNFPVFNLADSAIVAAACLVALLSLRGVPFGARADQASGALEPAGRRTRSDDVPGGPQDHVPHDRG